MNHSQTRRRLNPYLDGDLEPDERSRVDLHVRECHECAEQLRELRSTVALVRSIGEPEPPPRLAADVMARIRAGDARVSWIDRLWAALTSPAVSAPLAAGAVVLFALAILPMTPAQLPIPAGERVFARAELPPPEAAPISRAISPSEATVATRSAPAAETAAIAAAERAAEIPAPPRVNQSAIPGVALASARSTTPAMRRPAAFAGAPMEHGLTRVDQDLDRIVAAPNWFLEELLPLSDAYRESWIDGLAQRARQVNRSGEIAARVRETGHVLAPAVASRFEDGLTADAQRLP